MNCAYCGTSVVVPENLRATVTANPVAPGSGSMDLGQLIAGAVRMSQVVRLARGDLRSEAIQLYRENTGVDAMQAEKVIEALISGHGQNSAMMNNEMATVGEAIAAMRSTQEMNDRVRRSRRSGGIGCSGIFAFLIVAAAILIAVYNSTGTAHDLLIRLIAQLNLSGLIH